MTATGAPAPADGYGSHDLARRVAEPAKAHPGRLRAETARDRARVLHSRAWRRLAGTTQVVATTEPHAPRTRMTHSLETAQVGRELAVACGADPDLVDAACLAHDLGHPPFGHNGEVALDRAGETCGGFEGNAQSLRELVRLECKVLDDDGRPAGLNLTRAVLDAACKYPWTRGAGPDGSDPGKWGVYPDDEAAFAWVRRPADGVPPPGRTPSLEAQLMDWADDVAYCVHDLEDGVVAGQVDLRVLLDAGVRDELGTWAVRGPRPAGDAAEAAAVLADLVERPWWPRSHDGGTRARHALARATSELVARLSGAVQVHRRNPAEVLVRHGADVVVDRAARLEAAVLKAVTERFVMLRPGAAELQARQREVLGSLVEDWSARAPLVLPPDLAEAHEAAHDDAARLRAVLDAVARLTDEGALRAAGAGSPDR